MMRLLVFLLVIVHGSVAPPVAHSVEPPDQLRIMERIVLSEDVLDATDPGTLRAVAVVDFDVRGQPGVRLRQADGAARQPLPSRSLDLIHGLFAVTDEETSAPDDRRFAWHGEGYLSGFLTPVGDRMLLRAPFWLPESWQAALGPGGGSLVLNEGQPMLLREVITFVLPIGMPRLTLPAATEGRGGPLVWSLTWAFEGRGRRHLEAHLELVLERGELEGEDVAAFAAEVTRLHSVLGQGAWYTVEP